MLGKTALARDEVAKENIRDTAVFPSPIQPPVVFAPSSWYPGKAIGQVEGKAHIQIQ